MTWSITFKSEFIAFERATHAIWFNKIIYVNPTKTNLNQFRVFRLMSEKNRFYIIVFRFIGFLVFNNCFQSLLPIFLNG